MASLGIGPWIMRHKRSMWVAAGGVAGEAVIAVIPGKKDTPINSKIPPPVVSSGLVPDFTFTTTDITQDWPAINVTAGVGWWIDWGDGTVDSFIGTGADQNPTHNYAGAGTYTIGFGIDDPTALVSFQCNDNNLSGSIPDLSSNTTLLYFWCYNNSLTGSIPDLSSNTALVWFRCNDNNLSGSIPDLSSNTALLWFYCYNNNLSGYTASTIAAACIDFKAQNNALSLAAVDQILTDFTTNAGARPGTGTIDISGGTNATPTAATKAACVAALPGWTINTN